MKSHITAGGYKNTVSANYSSILGGSGNNDNGLAYAGIFGCNISNPLFMSACTFHVNGLNANSIPGPGPGLSVPGTVFWDVVGAAHPKALYIV